MKLFLGTSAVAVLAFATVSFAQSPKSPGAAVNSTLPESMQIQQRTQRQNSLQPTAPHSPNAANPATEAPGNPASPVGRNRIDPAAPSQHRLQIDEGQSARARENPDANAPQGGSGTSYNSIIRGSPSNSSTGASSGDGGSAAGSGVSNPSTSGAPRTSPSTGGSSSMGGSPSTGGSASGSAGGSSGGGSH